MLSCNFGTGMKADSMSMDHDTRLAWHAARRLLVETRLQPPAHFTVAWKLLAIFIAGSSLAMVLPLLLPRQVTLYYLVEVLLLLLEGIAVRGRLRDGSAISFLKSLPVPGRFLKRVIALAIVQECMVTAILFPAMLGIGALAIGHPGWIAAEFAVPGMITAVLVLPMAFAFAGERIVLQRTKTRRSFEMRDLEAKSMTLSIKSPVTAVFLKLAAIAFKDAKYLAYLVSPTVMSAVILLMIFTAPVSDDYFMFYWLVALHGFLCFFVIAGFSMAGERVKLLTQFLPFKTKYLVRAKQAFTTTYMFILSAITITIVAPWANNIETFVVLASSLFPIDLFYCWMMTVSEEFISSEATIGRQCILLFVVLNVTGSYYWFLTLIGHNASWLTFCIILASCIAWICILEVYLFKAIVK